MKTTLLRGMVLAAAACLTVAQADHMSPWGPGWANMPNDIHNTRIDTRGDNDAFRDFVRYGEGADSINRYLVEEAAAVEAELAVGHQTDSLSARLDPLPGFQGGGWARYTAFDGDPEVARLLTINLRLRLVRPNGLDANEALGITPDNAGSTDVSAHFRGSEGSEEYALCGLVFEGLVYADDGITAEYAVYGLSLKEQQSGLVEGAGSCYTSDDSPLPDVEAGDVVDIGVLRPEFDEEISPVLMGGF